MAQMCCKHNIPWDTCGECQQAQQWRLIDRPPGFALLEYQRRLALANVLKAEK